MNAGTYEEGGVRLLPPCRMLLIAGCLLLSLAACGAPVSEKAPGQVPSVSKGEVVGGTAATRAVQRGSDQNDRKAVGPGLSDSDTEERDNRTIPGVPEMVMRDLGSADPRERYRALEHWNIKGGNAPLDPMKTRMCATKRRPSLNNGGRNNRKRSRADCCTRFVIADGEGGVD